MLDMLCIGNATRDVFIDLGLGHGSGRKICLECGSKNEIKKIDFETGGGATNCAVSFSRLGLKTGVLIGIGKDSTGKNILKELKKEKIDTGLAIVESKYHSAYSAIVTGHKGDSVILTYGGATAHIESRDIKWKELNPKWAHITSFHSRHSVLSGLVNALFNKDTVISFNPGGKELSLGLKGLEKILGKVHVLFVNKHEAKMLCKTDDIEKAARQLQKHVPLVVITLSSKGAMAFDGLHFLYQKPYKVRVVDVTGAGDAFNSAFIAALYYGNDVGTALKWGSAQAASVISHLGAKNRLLSVKEILKFIGSHKHFG